MVGSHIGGKRIEGKVGLGIFLPCNPDFQFALQQVIHHFAVGYFRLTDRLLLFFPFHIGFFYVAIGLTVIQKTDDNEEIEDQSIALKKEVEPYSLENRNKCQQAIYHHE